MTLYDLLENLKDEPLELTNVLIKLDLIMKYLHDDNYYIYNFDPKKIILYNNQLTVNSFENVSTLITDDNSKAINILQSCKIGLSTFASLPIDGYLDQSYYEFLKSNIGEFKTFDIPEDLYSYYQDVFLNSHIDYLNNFLNLEKGNSNQNSLSRRKSLATNIGRSYVNNDEAYVKVLFIPTLMAFTYIISLVIYFILLK